MRKPFLLELAPFAPHRPATLAPQDTRKFADLKAPRGKVFNEADLSDKPAWLRDHRKLTKKEIGELDYWYRQRARSVQAIDRMIGRIRDLLKARGIADNTYVVFTSDNGFHLGEHRLRQGKLTAFDTDIHVPLVATGPGIRAGRTVRKLTENTDLCPTFVQIAGAQSPGTPDGQSLLPLLTGKGTWRSPDAVLIEHHGPDNDPDLPEMDAGNPPSYEAIRTTDALYTEYVDGEREYYNIRKDPDELTNTYNKHRDRLARTLHRLATCRGTTCRP